MASQMAPTNMKLGNWQKQNVLGSGGFGQVSLWVNIVTQEKIAIKLCKQQLRERQFLRWEQEVKIMKELHHESIVSFREVPKDIQVKFVGNFVALGMEFCELGDLRRMLGQPKHCCGLPEFQVRDFLSNIGSAINFLHDKKIIHRDIKPENIVMKSLGNERVKYKLIDLGYAKDLNEYSCGTSFVGTIHYLAPEFSTTQDLRYTETVDFWSFGLVSFECITGRRPFYPHFDNAMQFLSTLREKKRDEDLCTTDDDTPDPPFLSTIPQPHSLNSILADKLGKWLQKMLMLDAKLRGGGERTGQWYDHLQEILNEKHIQVCNTVTNTLVTIPVEQSCSVWNVKEKIYQKTNIQSQHQMLLFRDGDELNVMKNVIKECWHEPSSDDWKLHMFSQSMKSTPPNVTIPDKVQRLSEPSRTIQGSRAIRRILCLATHFINSQCRSCEQILFALFALQKCLDKRYSFFTRSMNELKKSYYKMLGRIEIYSRSLGKDKDELERLEAMQDIREYDAILEIWQQESDRLEKYKNEDIPAIEEFLQCETAFTTTTFLIKKAEQFVSTTMKRLSEIVKACYQHYDNIKARVRALLNVERRPRPANEVSPTDNGQELRSSLKDLLVIFIHPTFKEVSAYSQEAMLQIPALVKIVMDDLPPYVVQFNEKKAVVSTIMQNIQDDQLQRQQTLWSIIKYCNEEVQQIHSHFYNAYQQTVELGESVPVETGPGPHLTDTVISQHSRFAQLMHGIREETNMNDLLSLDWQYLHSEDTPLETPNEPSDAPITATKSAPPLKEIPQAESTTQ